MGYLSRKPLFVFRSIFGNQKCKVDATTAAGDPLPISVNDARSNAQSCSNGYCGIWTAYNLHRNHSHCKGYAEPITLHDSFRQSPATMQN
jgi:hypothetical protein